MFALATKRVLDGERIEYMKRVKPDTEEDTGWRFIAKGDSTSDLDKMHICPIEDAVLMNRSIRPYLESKVGTAYTHFRSGYIPVPQSGGGSFS